MRRLIIFLILLIASVWLGMEIIRHPGYLLLVYQPWMVQMPVWFALVSLILFLGLFYFLITGVDKINFLWFRLKNWLNLRREHKFYSKTQQGYAALVEWRFKKAEKLLLAGVNQSFEPLVNYLSAARAAHQQAAFDRRDDYIQKAYQAAPKADLAIGLTQAELEIEQDKFEQAAATLNHLREVSPRHPRVIKLLERIYAHKGDWKNLQSLLPAMLKAKLITKDEQEIFEKNIYCALFTESQDKRLSDVRLVWKDVPRRLKNNPDVVYAYVTLLLRHAPVTGVETTKEIEELIRKILKSQWDAKLAVVYGKLPLANLNRQLVIAGAWMKMYGPQPELLLLLGKLCLRLQLWGKARDYFEKCLAQGPNAEASLEYGKLLEQLGEEQEALQKYKEGLSQVSYGDIRNT